MLKRIAKAAGLWVLSAAAMLVTVGMAAAGLAKLATIVLLAMV